MMMFRHHCASLGPEIDALGVADSIRGREGACEKQGCEVEGSKENSPARHVMFGSHDILLVSR